MANEDKKLIDISPPTTVEGTDYIYSVRQTGPTTSEDYKIQINDILDKVTVPTDVSELTDTTNVIPADISELTDNQGLLVSGLPDPLEQDINFKLNELGPLYSLTYQNISFSAIDIDESGNIYVVGSYYNPSIKNFVLKFDQSFGLLWAKSYSDQYYTSYRNISYSNGKILLTYNSSSAVLSSETGDEIISTTLHRANSSYPVKIYDTSSYNGDFVYGSSFQAEGGNGPDTYPMIFTDSWNTLINRYNFTTNGIYSVAPASDGSVYALGKGNNPAYLYKFSSSGSLIWSRYAYDNSTYVVEVPKSVTVDSSDNVIYATKENGGYNTYVTKVDSSGNLLWKVRIDGDSSYESGLEIVAGTNDDVMVYFTEGSPGNSINLTKISSSGTFVWSKRLTYNQDLTMSSLTSKMRYDENTDNLFVVFSRTKYTSSDTGFILKTDFDGSNMSTLSNPDWTYSEPSITISNVSFDWYTNAESVVDPQNYTYTTNSVTLNVVDENINVPVADSYKITNAKSLSFSTGQTLDLRLGSNLVGRDGDKIGDVYINDIGETFYCFGNYDGSTTIWKKTLDDYTPQFPDPVEQDINFGTLSVGPIVTYGLGSTDEVSFNGVDVDNSGNIYISGGFTSSEGSGSFVRKLDSTYTSVWSKSYPGISNIKTIAHNNGTLYGVTGTSILRIDATSGVATEDSLVDSSSSNASTYDVVSYGSSYVAVGEATDASSNKYGMLYDNSTPMQAFFGGASTAQKRVYGVAPDPIQSGYFYILGNFTNTPTTTADPVVLALVNNAGSISSGGRMTELTDSAFYLNLLTTSNGDAIVSFIMGGVLYVYRFNRSFGGLWSVQFTNKFDDFPSVAMDDDDNIYVVGSYTDLAYGDTIGAIKISGTDGSIIWSKGLKSSSGTIYDAWWTGGNTLRFNGNKIFKVGTIDYGSNQEGFVLEFDKIGTELSSDIGTEWTSIDLGTVGTVTQSPSTPFTIISTSTATAIAVSNTAESSNDVELGGLSDIGLYKLNNPTGIKFSSGISLYVRKLDLVGKSTDSIGDILITESGAYKCTGTYDGTTEIWYPIERTNSALRVKNIVGDTYTVTGDDWNSVLVFDTANPVTLTVPDDVTENLEIGFTVSFRNKLGGAITITPTGTDIIDGSGTVTNDSTKVNSVYKESSGVWVTAGDLA